MAAVEAERACFPLSDRIAVVTFPGTDRPLLEALIHEGDCLIATGGADAERAVAEIVRGLRPKSARDLRRRVSGHWHKLSFDVVAREHLGAPWIERVAFNVAFDNSMFDTQGCLSAQQVFVEGGTAEARRFADVIVEQMRVVLEGLPKGAEPLEGLREMYTWYEGRPGVQILTRLVDIDTWPFFVAYEDRPVELATANALNRSLVVRRVDSLEADLPRLLGAGRRRALLQSVGLSAPRRRLLTLTEILGRAGVKRIVPAGDIWDMRLGAQSWDGYLPPMDLIAPQLGYWTTVSGRDPEAELERIQARNRALLRRR
jgi:hypothetical protein